MKGESSQTWPFTKNECAEMFGRKSAGSAATVTFPTFRNRLKQAIAYDPAKFHRLVAQLHEEIKTERNVRPEDQA